jgi:TetR/AcrR family transcriptional regulator, acrAB operon repressor
MPRRTAEDAARTRDAILDAGLEVFAKRGFAGAQLEDIAKRAALTRGAFYHHFTDKAELYAAVLKERWGAAMDPITAHLASAGAPAQRLRAFIVAFIESLAADRRVRWLLEMSLSGDSQLAELRRGRAGKARALEAWVEAISALLTELGAPEPDLRARAVVAYLNGIALSWVLSAPPFDPSNEADRLARAILGGVARR